MSFSFKTDRLGLLTDQLASSRDISQQRLEELTDEEFLWEPTPGAWSIRRRGETVSSHPYGTGEWQLDFAFPEADPAPVTTIAWRLGHLYAGFSGRWEWTFGERKAPRESIEFPHTAADMLDRFWTLMDKWQASIAAMTDEQLDMIGFGQYPGGYDTDIQFIAIIWWTNREFIHHMSEISLLRDLWAHRKR